MYDYNDLFNGLGSGYSSSSDWTGVFAAFAGFMIFLVLIVLAVAVFMIIATWILFKKCGKPGWAAIIPYYNTWVNNEIAGCHWIVFAAMILPTVASLLLNVTGVGSVVLSLISVFAGVCASYNLALKFKKGAGFCVGLSHSRVFEW